MKDSIFINPDIERNPVEFSKTDLYNFNRLVLLNKKAAKPILLVTLDAYGGDVFEASIIKIYPQKDIKTQTFRIEGLFNQPPKALYAGLSGEANIILSEKKRTMIIPLEYLMENNKVITERGELDVIVGLKNMESVEIISGIDTATIILKP